MNHFDIAFCSVMHLNGLGDPRTNEAMIARLNRERESCEYRARTTRLAKWREMAQQARLELELPPGAPENLQLLDWVILGSL